MIITTYVCACLTALLWAVWSILEINLSKTGSPLAVSMLMSITSVCFHLVYIPLLWLWCHYRGEKIVVSGTTFGQGLVILMILSLAAIPYRYSLKHTSNPAVSVVLASAYPLFVLLYKHNTATWTQWVGAGLIVVGCGIVTNGSL